MRNELGCHQVEKTVWHLFFECPWFSSIWYLCFQWIGVHSALYGDIGKQIYQLQGLIGAKGIQVDCWMVVCFTIIRAMWINRNKLIFHQQ